MTPKQEHELRLIFLQRSSDELETVRKITSGILEERRMIIKAGLN